MATGRFAAIKRQYLFAILLGPSVLLMVLLKQFGARPDLAAGLMFLPALAIFVWNRAQGDDRLQGLAAPTLALCLAMSLFGFTQYKQGSLVEAMHLVGLVGMVISTGWLFWFLLSLGGPARR